MNINNISSPIYQDNNQYLKNENEDRNDIQVPNGGIATAEQKKTQEKSAEQKLGNDQKNKSDQEAAKEYIKKTITRMNNDMSSRRTKAEFNYNEKLNRVSIKIFNEETGEIIREIPPEKTLEMVEKMLELAGLLYDERI